MELFGTRARINLRDQVHHWPRPVSTRRGDCPSERKRRSPSIEAVAVMFMERFLQARGILPPGELYCGGVRTSPLLLNLGFLEWVMGFPEGWLDLSLGSWRDVTKAFGNAVVPEQAAHAVRVLLARMEGDPCPSA
jgi:hypothetical protein